LNQNKRDSSAYVAVPLSALYTDLSTSFRESSEPEGHFLNKSVQIVFFILQQQYQAHRAIDIAFFRRTVVMLAA
jgi:hypothetical protein